MIIGDKEEPIDLIKDWATLFEHINEQTTPEDIDSSGVKLYQKLIQEEVKELIDGLNNKDISEVRDGIADSIWVIVVLALKLGIDIKKDIQEVYSSNVSKACHTYEEAIDTANAYREGRHPDKPGEVILAEIYPSKGAYLIRRLEDKKILKSINYKAVDFSN
jgi:NTP pyrophosphatase (non-canonical NTP hydrolase)